MDDAQKSRVEGAKETGQTGPVAAAELRSRKRDLEKRLEHMEAQRRALEEVRDSLRAEEQLLKEKVALVNTNSDQFASRVDSMAQRARDMERESEQLEQEIEILEQRCGENAKRNRELDAAILSSERDIVASRNEIFQVTKELESGRAALVRMDRKLADSGFKN